MLKMNDICVSYGKDGKKLEVLKNFSLELKQGEVVVVLGPSGCGKSTLLQVLAGMHPLDSGSVSFLGNGVELPQHPKTQRIAVIPQNCGLLPWKTVRANCLLPLRLHKQDIDENILLELHEICSLLKIDTLMERYPRELSGGQVQRVALARAFLQEPDLLLMDEPFSSLDEMTRSDAWELLLKVWNEKRPITLLVTHSIEEALYLGTRIIVLDKVKGKILKQLDNPYFGSQEREEEGILSLKRRLRETLKPTTDGGKAL